MKLLHLSWSAALAQVLAVCSCNVAAQTKQPPTQQQSPAQQPSASQSSTTTPGSATAAQRARRPDVLKTPTKDDLLRGAYGPYRANNDLLFYALKLRVDPDAKTIKGSNTIRFRMLSDGTRIQIELSPDLTIDGITFNGKPVHYERVPDTRTLYLDFPETLHKGKTYDVVFAYSGHPVTQGRFGCFSFDKDKEGKPWITTACEGEGPSIWWPNKDQWKDEPKDGMELDIAVPNGLMDVSNGRFEGSKDLGDGYTEWRWHVHYPINNYDVALNIGEYQHFAMPPHGKTTLDFYALPEDLDKAKEQFAQVPTMLDAYEHYLGEYPFDKDGYKLIEVPYAGMEHQSAVAYGNHFTNGYYGRDWTGVGISPRFDFIIIHESGHEWFGNSITAVDPSDMWIHEGWDTYLESLYVEYRWGKVDAIKYLSGYRPKIYNLRPIIAERGVNANPTEDQYFKGALMLNTLRSVMNDDAKWFALIKGMYQHFKHQQIQTEDIVAWFNTQSGMNLTPVFNQYLRYPHIPRLELLFGESPNLVMYKWDADEDNFAMPVRVGTPDHWEIIHPTTKWQWMQSPLSKDDFQVATDLYYVDVNKQ